MSVFKCKMCGGTIEFAQGATIGICDSCGTTQTLPRLDDDKKANLYDRANHFRRNNDYDKAMSIYEQILNEDNTDAEAYWSIVLCRYGIEYVEDPATRKMVPTVNRAQYTSIFVDEDYKSAVQYANIFQKSIYEQEARAIDEIQKGILEISKQEEPFDVFICYKETDANGRRTQDSVFANDLYHQLEQEGFKVFFSRITLEDKLGTAYEPYIFAALNSAKVMVVIGTKPEYFNAVWVKNEWSRYLALVKNSNGKKILIPAYRDMDPYDLPEEFSHLQAQDMSKLGFMQDLIRGIKKLTDAGSSQSAVRETVIVNTAPNAVNASTAPLLERAFLFLEDGKWQDANVYCEKVLDIDPKNAVAYLGKLMAELQVRNRKQLADCAEPFDDRDNYNKVLRFGDGTLETEMHGYITIINDRKKEYKTKIDCIAKAIIKHYKLASFETDKKNLEKEIDLLKKKAAEFPLKAKKLSDAKETIKTLTSQKTSLMSSKSNLGIFKIKEKQIIDKHIIEVDEKLNKLRNELQKLKSEIDDIKSISDIETLISEKRNKLEKLIADSTLTSDSLITYEEAIKELSENNTLKSDVIALYPKIQIHFAEVGDTFEFGTYSQTSSGNDQTPIEWQVLAKEDNRILVISKQALDCKPYNTEKKDITWENCSLRKWMNGTFLNAAFSAEVQEQILDSNVSADKNSEYSTNPGNDTTDKVFLLSINEAEKYFSSYEDRKCVPTAYAIAQGAYTNVRGKTASGEATCWWWLRSTGDIRNYAANVIYDGSLLPYGHFVDYDRDCVRPALWIN